MITKLLPITENEARLLKELREIDSLKTEEQLEASVKAMIPRLQWHEVTEVVQEVLVNHGGV